MVGRMRIAGVNSSGQHQQLAQTVGPDRGGEPTRAQGGIRKERGDDPRGKFRQNEDGTYQGGRRCDLNQTQTGGDEAE